MNVSTDKRCNNGGCQKSATYVYESGNLLVLACDDCYPRSREHFPGLAPVPCGGAR